MGTASGIVNLGLTFFNEVYPGFMVIDLLDL